MTALQSKFYDCSHSHNYDYETAVMPFLGPNHDYDCSHSHNDYDCSHSHDYRCSSCSHNFDYDCMPAVMTTVMTAVHEAQYVTYEPCTGVLMS